MTTLIIISKEVLDSLRLIGRTNVNPEFNKQLRHSRVLRLGGFFYGLNEINEAQGLPPLNKPQSLFPVASIVLLGVFVIALYKNMELSV